ncbi:MAG: cellulase family glycosylhydrolase [bacterium]|nr:cellulase family glycosylhydrolase [bacterium]
MSKKVRRMLLGFALGMIAIFFLGTSERKVHASTATYMKSLKDGINLGNTYETGVEETKIKDPAVAKKIVDNLKKQGYSTIRLPITLNKHFDKKTGVVEDSYYKEIEVMLKAAIDGKLQVILTMYGDSYQWLNDMSNQKATIDLYKKVWKQIALHYKSYSDYLSFEGANAPYYNKKNQSEQLMILNKMNQEFVKTVRKTGGKNSKRTLFISTLNGAVTEEACNSMAAAYKKLKDDNVAVSVHYYGLWSFSVNACGKTTFDQMVKKDISTFVALVKKKFISKKIPVVCTEYGLYGQETENQSINVGEQQKYYEEFLYQVKKAKLPVLLWDNGKLYNREQGMWTNPALRKLFVAAKKSRSSYVNTDSIYLKKGSQMKDKSLMLTLHEGNLKSIQVDGKALVLNQDYEVKGNKVTIKAEYLKKVVDQHAADLGQYQTMLFQFTKGAPFGVHIYGYNSAILSTNAGTVNGFTIPTSFNGDRLITMESFNTSHQTRGPITYSTFQEYGNSFEPDYENGAIELKKAFLSTLKEEQTILVFHFASGEVKTYTIKRSKDVIQEVNYKKTTALPSPVVTKVPTQDATQAVTETPVASIVPSPTATDQSIAAMSPVDGQKKHNNGIMYSIFLGIIILLLLVYSLYFLRKRSMQRRLLEHESTEKSADSSIDK